MAVCANAEYKQSMEYFSTKVHILCSEVRIPNKIISDEYEHSYKWPPPPKNRNVRFGPLPLSSCFHFHFGLISRPDNLTKLGQQCIKVLIAEWLTHVPLVREIKVQTPGRQTERI